MKKATVLDLTPKVLLALAVCAAVSAQQPVPRAEPADPFLEYPPYEIGLVLVVRPADGVKKTADMAAQPGDSVDKVRALIALAARRGANRVPLDAVAAMRDLIERHPDAIVPALDALSRGFISWNDGAYDPRPAVRELLDAAQAKVPALPPQQASDLAYELIRARQWLDRGEAASEKERLETLIKQYPGTEAALRAELDLGRDSVPNLLDIKARVAMFDRFVATHPGTCAAATALRSKAFELGANIPGGQDPTERFLPAFDVVRQLETTPYRRCITTPDTQPRQLVNGLYAYKPVYAPGNVDRLLAAYQAFVRSHFDADSMDPSNGLGFVIANRMLELYRTKGEGTPALDRFLADVEKEVAEPEAVRYLRALIYFVRAGWSLSGFPPETLPPGEARARLAALAESGHGLYQRRALATLAWVDQYEGDPAQARDAYTKYAKQNPRSPYAWVAALRAAQCAAEQGDWPAAAAGYQGAARTYSSVPVARALGHAYAARALEAMQQAGQALAEYQAAADGWDSDYGPRLAFSFPRRQQYSPGMIPSRDESEVTPDGLAARVAQLKRTLAAAGGEALEQGRWLLEHRRPNETAQLLTDFATRYPRSANIREAQYLAHKARLYDALATLDIEGAANERDGVQALDALAAGPYDFPVLVAKMSRAIVVAQQGKRDEAEKAMRAALDEWRVRQDLREPASALEKDLAEIRTAVFRPLGGGVYDSSPPHWNGFSWPPALPPFLVVNPDVMVTFAGAPATRVSLAQRFPGLDNVLFVDTEQVGCLNEMMLRLGGTKRREGRIFWDKGVMEAPNQPMGAALDIIRFLALFFEARPGHWGGWEYYTYPSIGEIEFMNAERTAARVRVVIGYAGCDVLLEKTGGAWRPTRLVNMWVT